MALRCTCGAYPPDDALFCHKCGRPMRELPGAAAEDPAPAAPPPLPVTPDPAQVWDAGRAMRTALTAAGACLVFLLVPLPVLLKFPQMLVGLLGAGFLAARLYARRMPGVLPVPVAARLGWMTGLFTWLVVTLCLALLVLGLTQSPELSRMLEEQLRAASNGRDAKEAMDALVSPLGIAFNLGVLFLMFTMLASIGGALAARFKGRLG